MTEHVSPLKGRITIAGTGEISVDRSDAIASSRGAARLSYLR